jgi:hypothetical protein
MATMTAAMMIANRRAESAPAPSARETTLAENGARNPDKDGHGDTDRVSAGYHQAAEGADHGTDDDEPDDRGEHDPFSSRCD